MVMRRFLTQRHREAQRFTEEIALLSAAQVPGEEKVIREKRRF
jgi:hypothetical protein